MEGIGFTTGRSSPCIFHHKDRDVRAVVHGDDFTILGHESELDWFRKKIAERFEVKFRGRLGPTPKDDKSIRILNRVVTWTTQGIEYEPDQRHADLIIQAMDLQAAIGVLTLSGLPLLLGDP